MLELDLEDHEERHRMWTRLIENYDSLSATGKKKAKRKFTRKFNCLPHQIEPAGDGWKYLQPDARYYVCYYGDKMKYDLSLADCPTTTSTAPVWGSVCGVPTVYYGVKQEKEDTMYPTCNTKTDTRAATANVNINAPAAWDKAQTAQEYLLNRLRDALYPKYSSVDKVFKFGETNVPKTLTELMDRLKKGDYKLDKDGEKRLKREALDSEYGDIDDDFYFQSAFTNYLDWQTEPFDQEGWEAARQAVSDAYDAAKDVVMVSSAEDGLKALQAFEATKFA